jgi:hypothetical membrane protein
VPHPLDSWTACPPPARGRTTDRTGSEETGGRALGPRAGGALWLVAAIQFVAAMAVTQVGWRTPYSLLTNPVSDLGAVHCGIPPGGGPYVCSPWHAVFDASVVLVGLLVIAGLVGLRRVFPPGRRSAAGFGLVILSALGAIGVGLFPEDVNGGVHGLVSLMAFGFGNAAILVLGSAVAGAREWRGFPTFSAGLGGVGFAALAVFLLGTWGALGPGGAERLIIGPELLWIATVGAHALRLPDSRNLAGRAAPAATSSGTSGL